MRFFRSGYHCCCAAWVVAGWLSRRTDVCQRAAFHRLRVGAALVRSCCLSLPDPSLGALLCRGGVFGFSSVGTMPEFRFVRRLASTVLLARTVLFTWYTILVPCTSDMGGTIIYLQLLIWTKLLFAL